MQWRKEEDGHGESNLVGISSPSHAISDAVVALSTGALRLCLVLSSSFTLFCVVLSPFGIIFPSWFNSLTFSLKSSWQSVV
jgi:hypothetical protein